MEILLHSRGKGTVDTVNLKGETVPKTVNALKSASNVTATLLGMHGESSTWITPW